MFKHRRKGLTLIEVTITMVLLMLIILGTTKGVIFSRVVGENAIRDNIATNVAMGYIEQIRSLDYSDLLSSHRDTSIPIETKGASMTAQLNLINNQFSGITDQLYLGGGVNEKTILLDFIETSEGEIKPTVTMDMEFEITTTDLSTSADEWDALQFDVLYRYEKLTDARSAATGKLRWVEKSIRFVVANTDD